MNKTYEWFFAYRTVCGKIQPVPSNFLLFYQKFDATHSTAPKYTETSSLIDPFNVKDPYPALGAFVCVGVFLGVRLDTMLLNQKHNNQFFRQIVGLKNSNEVKIIDAQASMVYNSQPLGYFQVLISDIIPVDFRKTAPPFGSRYHTGTSF